MQTKWHHQFPRSGKGKHMTQIVDFIQQYKLKDKQILDYGCGKGGTMDWIMGLYSDCQVTGWDTGTDRYDVKPTQKFDAIYSIDVWEHIELEHIPEQIAQLRELTGPQGVWCHIIDLTPAVKQLPDGRNAHVTLQTATQWRDVFSQSGCTVTELSQFAQPDPNFGERLRCQIHCRP